MNEMVILVDKHDNQLGLMEKIEAHKKAVLHRAFSVFILNDNNELLIQQRALSKYHSPALWTNTCCSHPRDGESVLDAGARRLKEEMGFETKLDSLLSFVYRAKFDNGLTEHEFDHVLFGYYNDDPSINKLEVMDWKWVNLDFLKNDIITNSDLYTIWFKIIFEKFYKNFNK
ncbi:MAG: isopentenyl-diphosphate delta-isomerase [Flavobacteriaceae bacterium]|nr:isopentenyl-diphosphate delta-isomerase [Flavobacteriaceae bacterium]RCL67208.1 MAG: isopentenyl-diphosphate Delta-isomerase [Cryomorphaceae bacterium]|tara:strand:+ start:2063 stop:2578 length:516 start_codon:yes stop_codon:yes gene_type:complete